MSFIFHALVKKRRHIMVLIKRPKVTKTRLLMTLRRMMKSKRRRQKNMYMYDVVKTWQDLDIAVVKVINHVECPPKEKHV